MTTSQYAGVVIVGMLVALGIIVRLVDGDSLAKCQANFSPDVCYHTMK